MFKDRDTYFEIEDLKKFGVKAVYTTKKIGDIDILFKDKEKSSENIFKCFGKENAKVIYAKQTHTANVIDIKEDTQKYFYEEVTALLQKEKMLLL